MLKPRDTIEWERGIAGKLTRLNFELIKKFLQYSLKGCGILGKYRKISDKCRSLIMYANDYIY
jgi:hypothetical protein